MRTHPLEVNLRKEGFCSIAGLDEAGRGPWAGPLVAAAVILKPSTRIPDINDSKKLTEKKRLCVFNSLLKKASIGIGIVTNKTIDTKGLAFCIKLAYKKAIKNLPVKPDFLLIDGIGTYNFNIPYKTVKFGDSKVKCVAAASIIAKVVRDTVMEAYNKKYPKYAFSLHKGYGTQLHQKKLLKHGVCGIHRQSFTPIKTAINGSKKT